MSLFSRSLRPPTTDDAIDRYLASLRSRTEPDPLFRRRLRSEAINRFVAASQQVRLNPVRERARHMGRVGRACLYASVALATSAAGVLGASQEALPGDVLYGVKVRVERLRFEVVPEHLQGVLAADVVAERLDEMGRLVDAGRMAEAVAMQPAIAAEIDHLVAVEAGGSHEASDRIAQHLLVLDGLIDKLPAASGAAVRAAWDKLPSHGAAGNGPALGGSAGTSAGSGAGSNAGGNGGANSGGAGNGSANSGGGSSGGSNGGGLIDPPAQGPNPAAPGQATDTPQPEPTDRPDRGQPGDPGARASGQGEQPSPGAESSD